jgi:hypothetical protein
MERNNNKRQWCQRRKRRVWSLTKIYKKIRRSERRNRRRKRRFSSCLIVMKATKRNEYSY